MTFEVAVYPTMPTRPCHLCLSLKDGSVFADLDVDEVGCVFLRRISFDGYGCCVGDFKKMSADDSRFLIKSVENDAVDDPKIEELLRRYFEENADVIWRDALVSHELL